jgi:hypothetical protein
MSDWSLPPDSRLVRTTPREGVEVIQARWDEKLGVAFISHPTGLSLTTTEEVQRWSDELHAKLEIIFQQHQGKFPIVVSVDGFYIRPAVAELYGRVVSTYMERFASGVARYVHKPNGVGQIITVAAMKEGYRANLFSTRSDAIAHALAEANRNRSKSGG